MMEKSIHQGSRVISRPRMDDHPRGFVYHDKMTILVEDRQGDGLSLDLQPSRLRKGESDDIVLPQPQPCLGFPFSHLNISFFDEPFELGPGERGYFLREEDIQPFGGVFGIDQERGSRIHPGSVRERIGTRRVDRRSSLIFSSLSCF